MKIEKDDLLVIKESGTYGCPNYIDPKFGKKILDAHHIDSDSETSILFTEIIENFGIELVKSVHNKLTKDKLIELVHNISI